MTIEPNNIYCCDCYKAIKDIKETDFNTYLGYIKEFFEISKPSIHYEQLSLF